MATLFTNSAGISLLEKGESAFVFSKSFGVDNVEFELVEDTAEIEYVKTINDIEVYAAKGSIKISEFYVPVYTDTFGQLLLSDGKSANVSTKPVGEFRHKVFVHIFLLDNYEKITLDDSSVVEFYTVDTTFWDGE